MDRKTFIELVESKGHLFFNEAELPEEIPTLSKGGEGKTSSSPYHSYKTIGHIMVPAHKNGEEWWEENSETGERYRMFDPISDACVVEASETEIFDPTFVVGDIWGNLWASGPEGDVQIT